MSDHHPYDSQARRLAALLERLLELRQEVFDEAAQRLAVSCQRDARGRPGKSACNLSHYLALRRHDLRPLQAQLAEAGISSLGRSEAHVAASLNGMIDLLGRALGDPRPPIEVCASPDFSEGKALLAEHATALFGAVPSDHSVRIMVTLPVSCDGSLVRQLIEAGTSCVRINCAYGGPEQWGALVAQVRKAAKAQGRDCRILMDLAGHKLRTGPIVAGPAVLRLRTRKDRFGRVTAPALLRLHRQGEIREEREDEREPLLALPAALFGRLAQGDLLQFEDLRGKARSIVLLRRTAEGDWLGECGHGAYLTCETRLTWLRDGRVLGSFEPAGLPEAPAEVRVFPGETLLLGGESPGIPPQRDDKGRLLAPARVPCTLPQVLGRLRAGESVFIDDGKLGFQVEEQTGSGVLLRAVEVPPQGGRVRPDKGINLPETLLELPPLSEKDLADLGFICAHADMVGLSFVERRSDLEQLMAELRRRGAAHLPIIAKIETRSAVRNLPEILFAGLGRHRLGVMIARGDLAVELGWERMAEIQEEILWLCEAAHVPVIWATQVLESLAKKGGASRPEVTDAAMASRAECVMLNKGPYIVRAVRMLAGILGRMEAHQYKKSSQLRALHW